MPDSSLVPSQKSVSVVGIDRRRIRETLFGMADWRKRLSVVRRSSILLLDRQRGSVDLCASPDLDRYACLTSSLVSCPALMVLYHHSRLPRNRLQPHPSCSYCSVPSEELLCSTELPGPLSTWRLVHPIANQIGLHLRSMKLLHPAEGMAHHNEQALDPGIGYAVTMLHGRRARAISPCGRILICGVRDRPPHSWGYRRRQQCYVSWFSFRLCFLVSCPSLYATPVY